MSQIGEDIELVQRERDMKLRLVGTVLLLRDCDAADRRDIQLVLRELDMVKLWLIGTLVHLRDCDAADWWGHRAGAESGMW
jgi:hypothetical protein